MLRAWMQGGRPVFYCWWWVLVVVVGLAGPSIAIFIAPVGTSWSPAAFG